MLSNSASSVYGLFLIMGLHGIAMLAFVIGLIFFVAWAIKNLKKDQLFKLSIILMVIGLLTCLLTMAFGGFGYHNYKYSKGLNPGIMMQSGKWDAVKSKAKEATSATTTTDAKTTTDPKATTTTTK